MMMTRKTSLSIFLEWLFLLGLGFALDFFVRKIIPYDAPSPWFFYGFLVVLFLKSRSFVLLFGGSFFKFFEILFLGKPYENFAFLLFFFLSALFFQKSVSKKHASIWFYASLVLGFGTFAYCVARFLDVHTFSGLLLPFLQFLVTICFLAVFLFLFFEEDDI